MNKIITSSLAFITGAIMLSSNVNGQGITIEKRHYKGGYYIDFGKKKVNTKAASEVKQNVTTIEANGNNAVLPLAPVVSEQMQMVPVNNQSTVAVDAKTTKKESNKNNVAKKISEIYNNKVATKGSPVIANDVVASPDVITNTKAVEGGGGTVPLIVLIILAIIIPPLAVYLHDGQIATHFWWILILWLLGIGFGIGIISALWLLDLIAIIWAIVIVTGSAGGR